MASFRINISQVRSQANRMTDLSQNLSNEIRRLENMMDSLRSGWQGPAADTYRNQLLRLVNDMKRTQSKIRNVASDILSVAARIQAEDERAARAAKKLK